MKLFKNKKKPSELDLELKKYPKRKRKHLRDLYSQYENGKILKVENIKEIN